jgi:hypothetical protein
MTAFGQWLLLTPFWLTFVILFGGLLVSARIGWYLRQKLPPSGSDTKDETSDRTGYVLTSVMGLLALLVGFTFSLAIDRFDARRANVVTEAAARRAAPRSAEPVTD